MPSTVTSLYNLLHETLLQTVRLRRHATRGRQQCRRVEFFVPAPRTPLPHTASI